MTTLRVNELTLFVFYIIIFWSVFPGVCYLNLDLGNILPVLTMWINLKPHTPVGVLISASQVSPCAAGSIPFTCRTAIKLIFLIFCLLCTQPNNTHNLIFSSEKAFMRGNDSCWAFSMLYIILMHLDTSAGMFSGVIMCCRAWESLHPAAFAFFHLLGLEL